MSDPNQNERADVRSYLIGYAAALTLTCAAFAAVRWPGLGSTATLVAILVLALSQMIVHFRFFLHITFARSARDDLTADPVLDADHRADGIWHARDPDEPSVADDVAAIGFQHRSRL